MRVVAIDPGANGGVVCISRDEPSKELTLHSIVDMPNLDTAKGLHELMGLMNWSNGRVVVETQRGRSGNSVKGTWNHARHYGKLEVCLSLVDASTTLVLPSVWMGKVKKVIGSPSVIGMKETKARTWTLAHQLFPDAVMTGPRGRKKDGLADAVCLGWYYLLHLQEG